EQGAIDEEIGIDHRSPRPLALSCAATSGTPLRVRWPARPPRSKQRARACEPGATAAPAGIWGRGDSAMKRTGIGPSKATTSPIDRPLAVALSRALAPLPAAGSEGNAGKAIDPHHALLLEACLVAAADGVDLIVAVGGALIKDDEHARALLAHAIAAQPLTSARQDRQAVGKAGRHFGIEKGLPIRLGNRAAILAGGAEQEVDARQWGTAPPGGQPPCGGRAAWGRPPGPARRRPRPPPRQGTPDRSGTAACCRSSPPCVSASNRPPRRARKALKPIGGGVHGPVQAPLFLPGRELL